ncbi:MAG: NAD-dependent protein deacylase [Oscillospiraceae bacterium]|jgi:NAD-dependent deacetylase|nr:NAD-dependent protein deacylase [Oscillospiraceae bacterium]
MPGAPGAYIDKLREWIAGSGNIVFFGGAGVSTESGIPDFRSVDGLYSQKYAYPPEEILSRSFFMSRPAEFYKFYREKILVQGVAPNKAHTALAKLEERGKLRAVVTQNIDGLHQAAGSRRVFELHGSTHRNYCMGCGARYGFDFMLGGLGGVPKCTKCGGTVRPDVVLYEEPLDTETVNGAARSIRGADMLIVGGTSLVVYPAAGLVDLYAGDKLALINKSPTARDGAADLLISGSIGEILEEATNFI